MDTEQLDVGPKWGVELIGYLAGVFILFIFVPLLVEKGIQIFELGLWSGYISLIFMILAVAVGLFTILYYLSHKKYMDDKGITKKDLFGTTTIPYSQLDQAEIESLGIKLQGAEKTVDLDIMAKNYGEAIELLKDKLKNRSDLTIKGKPKHIRKHFGENFQSDSMDSG